MSKLWAYGFFLGIELGSLGEEHGKSETVLTLFNTCILKIFCSNGMLELLYWIPRLPKKVFLSVSGC